jgi:hypothetical protein
MSTQEREQNIRDMFDKKSNSIAKSQEQKDRELNLYALELELKHEELELKREELDFQKLVYEDKKRGFVR